MSLVEEEPERRIRMAHLAVVGSHAVNGVAQLHSELVKTRLLPDFHALWPERFQNKTNGVTHRRWLVAANPELTALITECIGPEWIEDTRRLSQLAPHALDAATQERFAATRSINKQRLARIAHVSTGVSVDPASLFDVHVKRIHEYKRQLLNVMHVIHRYLKTVEDGVQLEVPRTVIFSGKAAPGYAMAKLVIRLINGVGRRRQQGPAHRRQPARRVPARLPRLARGADHAGGGPQRTDLDGRNGGVRDRAT